MSAPGRGRDRDRGANIPNSFSSSHLNLGRVLSHGDRSTQTPPPSSHAYSSSFSASTTNLASPPGGASSRENRSGFFRSAGSHFTNRVRKISQTTSPTSASPSAPAPAASSTSGSGAAGAGGGAAPASPAMARLNRQYAAVNSRSPQSSRPTSHAGNGSSEPPPPPPPPSRSGPESAASASPAGPPAAVPASASHSGSNPASASAPMSASAPAPAAASTPPESANDLPPAHRIRLVPHISNGRSVVFEVIERDVREGLAPIKFGRFTDRSGGASDGPDGRGFPQPGPGARGGAIPNINGGRGRIDQNRVAFRSKVVSRSHAELWSESGGRFFIRDTKSSSGTFLNHIRLSGPGIESIPFAVKDGDVIQLGVDYQSGSEESYRCVKMRVELNRGWQRRANEFNTTALRQLRTLQGEPTAEAGDGAQPADKAQTGQAAPGASNHAPGTKSVVKPAAVTDCCICLFSVTVCQSLFIAPCSHVFHYKCIRPLLQKHHPAFSCPLCRTYADLEADVEEEEEAAELEAALSGGTESQADTGAASGSCPAPAPGSDPPPAPASAAPAPPETLLHEAQPGDQVPSLEVIQASPLVNNSTQPERSVLASPEGPSPATSSGHGRNHSFAPTIAPTGDDVPIISADGMHAMSNEDMEMVDAERDASSQAGPPPENYRPRNWLKRPSPTGDPPQNQGRALPTAEAGRATSSSQSRRLDGPSFPVQFSTPEEDEELQPAIPVESENLWRRNNSFAFSGFNGGSNVHHPSQAEDDADVTRAMPMAVGSARGAHDSNPFAHSSHGADDFGTLGGSNGNTVVGLDNDAFNNPMNPHFAASLGASLGQTPRNDVLFAPSAEWRADGGGSSHR